MKRYLHEKIAFIQQARPDDEHVLIIPGAKDEIVSAPQSRVYTVRSPSVSRTTQYRILLNLGALDEIIAREKPDLIESGDPYQVGWKALRLGHDARIPVVAFYHSHFVEAYLREPAKRLGPFLSAKLMTAGRSYVRNLYNRFDATLVPSAGLEEALRGWGVRNTRRAELGVNTEIFHPGDDAAVTRDRLGLPHDRTLLLYVGRLAPEKNTRVLFQAFSLLQERLPNEFHLLVIGDGQERDELRALQDASGQVGSIPYCTDSSELAQYYRAADLFVHPGIEETFGLVALESQACGTPVVGIRGTYMDGVIFHRQDEWANENSPRALADAIEKMSARDLAEMGREAAVEARERYAWPRVFERIFAIYRDVIGR